MERFKALLLLVTIAIAAGGIGVSFSASPLAAVIATYSCEVDPEEEDGGQGNYCNCADLQTPNKTCKQTQGSQLPLRPTLAVLHELHLHHPGIGSRRSVISYSGSPSPRRRRICESSKMVGLRLRILRASPCITI
jgi:hypothetical protein